LYNEHRLVLKRTDDRSGSGSNSSGIGEDFYNQHSPCEDKSAPGKCGDTRDR